MHLTRKWIGYWLANDYLRIFILYHLCGPYNISNQEPRLLRQTCTPFRSLGCMPKYSQPPLNQPPSTCIA